MTQDEVSVLLNNTTAAEKRKNKGNLKSWYLGETDLINDNLRTKKVYEDHIKKEPDAATIETDDAKVWARVFDRNGNKRLKRVDTIYRISAVIFCILLSILMTFAMSYAPVQNGYSPANRSEVPKRYIENGMEETGAVNIVAGMILDYRAFDTLGESHVLFIATIIVLILMRDDKKELDRDEFKYEPGYDPILQTVSRVLVPVILVFGIYVILNGHISPGGGFSGGAVIGAGLILHANAFGFEQTEKFFSQRLYKLVTFISLAFYALAKCYSFYCGANHLESIFKPGTPGAILSAGLILPLNIAVGLVVACTMYAFYAHFRKGGF